MKLSAEVVYYHESCLICTSSLARNSMLKMSPIYPNEAKKTNHQRTCEVQNILGRFDPSNFMGCKLRITERAGNPF